jgi:4-amino-4-deoxy-L-arabinose transferase-like glycosyltransferase
VIAGLIIGGVVLLAMVCVSWYGWVTLPADARVPVHFGLGSYNNFMPKRIGLLLHPAAGALVYVLVVVAGSSHGTHGRSLPVEVILPLIMCLLLVVQAGAIRVARRRPGSGLLS